MVSIEYYETCRSIPGNGPSHLQMNPILLNFLIMLKKIERYFSGSVLNSIVDPNDIKITPSSAESMNLFISYKEFKHSHNKIKNVSRLLETTKCMRRDWRPVSRLPVPNTPFLLSEIQRKMTQFPSNECQFTQGIFRNNLHWQTWVEVSVQSQQNNDYWPKLKMHFVGLPQVPAGA